ncbi:MAG: DUF3619 family protein [Sterolibacterium sp.]|jgi:hypothetical protein|nr:DUF3619 family protein [Sterolibacterium sp.]
MNDHLHDEQQFAHKVRHHLDLSTGNVDALTLNKLMMARQAALAQHKLAPIAGLRLAGVGNILNETLMPRARTLFALLALAVGVTGSYFWSHFQQAEENEEIDSALLSDDLPINAYLDHGFHEWLAQPPTEDSAESLPE